MLLKINAAHCPDVLFTGDEKGIHIEKTRQCTQREVQCHAINGKNRRYTGDCLHLRLRDRHWTTLLAREMSQDVSSKQTKKKDKKTDKEAVMSHHRHSPLSFALCLTCA